MTSKEFTRAHAVRSVANTEFNRAVLEFRDGSHIRFEHTSRRNRWARASSEDATAGDVCGVLSQFRLNRKHLQLFFKDGTDVEFRPAAGGMDGTALG
jgi:hypothetical protein